MRHLPDNTWLMDSGENLAIGVNIGRGDFRLGVMAGNYKTVLHMTTREAHQVCTLLVDALKLEVAAESAKCYQHFGVCVG